MCCFFYFPLCRTTSTFIKIHFIICAHFYRKCFYGESVRNCSMTWKHMWQPLCKRNFFFESSHAAGLSGVLQCWSLLMPSWQSIVWMFDLKKKLRSCDSLLQYWRAFQKTMCIWSKAFAFSMSNGKIGTLLLKSSEVLTFFLR